MNEFAIDFDDIDYSQQLDALCKEIKIDLNEQQREFAIDFTRPTISCSNPGTGKTSAMVVGLIMAQTVYGIPGKKINAMSFTKEATIAIKQKYDDACRKLVSPDVQFNTFHSICYRILRDAYPDMQIKEGIDYNIDIEALSKYIEMCGIKADDKYFVKNVLQVINRLNSAFIYDEQNIEEDYGFKRLEIEVEDFQKIRKSWFTFGKITNCITRGDIPTYARYALSCSKQLQDRYKEKYQIMVVDEFQDLSLLYLKILAMISNNLIVMGDMKQQIYAFNGASPRIVQEYMQMYPDAKAVELTQSYRCADEVADYATVIEHSNDNALVPFKGVGEGGSIQVVGMKEFNIQKVVDLIKVSQESGKREDVMFLCRNNSAITPIAEVLYKKGVLFRVNKFVKVMDMPIFKDLCTLIEAALHPTCVAGDTEGSGRIMKALKLFPEFRKNWVKDCPLIAAMIKSGKSLFDIKYRFREESSECIINAMIRVSVDCKNGVNTGRLFNDLIPVYSKYIIENMWWKFELPKETYFDLVRQIVTKEYKKMVEEENDKERKIRSAIDARLGVKCYTLHSSKGLEARDVYILDAEDALLPSKKVMDRYVTSQCIRQAAEELRSERNLLYVGITRAKKNVTIVYRDALTDLIASPKSNKYTWLDDKYREEAGRGDDDEAFERVLGKEIRECGEWSRVRGFSAN